ncbi:MAG TPA: hypothetical protein PLR60_16380 [Syntrophorhabdaceae bacterium]|nr:hypothetical protein [Syntrophorhabdaceae bacterium]
MDKTLKIVVIVCSCVIAFSAFYYLVIFLPMEKRAERAETIRKEQAARLEKMQKKTDYENCMERARLNNITSWDRNCERLHRKPDCALPLKLAEMLDKIKKDREEQCFKEYTRGE